MVSEVVLKFALICEKHKVAMHQALQSAFKSEFLISERKKQKMKMKKKKSSWVLAPLVSGYMVGENDDDE